jgi:hypothetical protein
MLRRIAEAPDMTSSVRIRRRTVTVPTVCRDRTIRAVSLYGPFRSEVTAHAFAARAILVIPSASVVSRNITHVGVRPVADPTARSLEYDGWTDDEGES